MKIKPIVLVLSSIALLYGCSSNRYSEIMAAWVGHDVQELVDSKRWGYPASTFVSPNGNTVYRYVRSGEFSNPTTTNSTYNVYGNTVTGSSTSSGGGTTTLSCTSFFEVDSNNKIVTWKYQGNACKAFFGLSYSGFVPKGKEF